MVLWRDRNEGKESLGAHEVKLRREGVSRRREILGERGDRVAEVSDRGGKTPGGQVVEPFAGGAEGRGKAVSDAIHVGGGEETHGGLQHGKGEMGTCGGGGARGEREREREREQLEWVSR